MTSLEDYEKAFADPPKPRDVGDLYSNAVGYDITSEERSQLEDLSKSSDDTVQGMAQSALEIQERFDRGCYDNLATRVH